jgi:hypothetical protein
LGPLPLPYALAVMAAAINGKRRRWGSSHLSSPSSPCSYLSSRSSSCPPLCSRSTPLHALEHQFSSAPPPRFPAAAVNSSPPVKDWFRRSSFLIIGVARGLSSSYYCRFSSPTPVGAAPRPPERRPIRCRCQVPSPAPSLRF